MAKKKKTVTKKSPVRRSKKDEGFVFGELKRISAKDLSVVVAAEEFADNLSYPDPKTKFRFS